MLDEAGDVLYVGKARNLKKRVSSYFGERGREIGKTRALMAHTRRVEVTITNTETEALLLENNLVKQFQPRYNVLLRDDKSFPFIYLASDEDFPRLAFHRGPRRGAGRYFGPYPSAGATRSTLNLLQKLFRVRQCENSFFRNRSRPCLQHQIKRCTAPCVDMVSTHEYAQDVRHAVMFLDGKSEEMIEELVTRMRHAAARLDFEAAARYRDQISSVRHVQERQYISGARGNADAVAAVTRAGLAVVEVSCIRNGQLLGSQSYYPRNVGESGPGEVLEAFLAQHYLSRAAERSIPADILVSDRVESAGALSDVLRGRAGHAVTVSHRIRGDRARWVDLARTNASNALAQQLADRHNMRARFQALQDTLDLDEVPQRIECFDISHTRGEAAVASCVVFAQGGAVKSDYRRFNIEDVTPGDDYAAMRQALSRRYTRLRREDGKLPDVLFVDGGAGQLAQALEVLRELQVAGVVLGAISKGPTRKAGLETLHLPGSAPMALPPDNPALHLIQQIRDEAHRFAITGHRARRNATRRKSHLEHIPGIGARRRQRLLTEFGGLQGVARAGIEDLCRVKGISRNLARAIYDSFRDDA